MIKNYLLTAWRTLIRNKFYTLLNVAGLTVGMVIGMLILLWVQNEHSYDGFHQKTADIYKIEIFGGTGSSRQIWHEMVAPIGPLAKKELPEVREQVRISGNYFFSLYKYQDKVFANEKAVFTDPSFFSMFDFPLVYGNVARPYTDNHSVILTKKTAIKYFGTENAVGKVISADSKENLTVTGVINDFPDNSSMQYDMMMPMTYLEQAMLAQKQDINNDFYHFGFTTFLLLKPGTNLVNLSKELFNIHIAHKSDDTDAEYLIQPLSKMHLFNSDGSSAGIETVRIFFIVALLILIIACINYVNLATARSMLRAKEISMRKIIGAARWQLFLQFFVETAILFLLVTILAGGLSFVLLPLFNQISGRQLVFNLEDFRIWKILLITVSGALLASSIYPALLLSSFEPLKALKGKISAGIGDAMFRRVLVVTQFVFSVALIIGTIVITRQLKYVRSKELGYDKSNVFSFWMRDMNVHYDAVKKEIEQQPGVLAVTRGGANIVQIGGLSGDTEWDGKEANQTFIVHPMAIDQNFLSFFKMGLTEGVGFSGVPADSTHIILNQEAIRELGMKNPIGKRFRISQIKGTIIGVVKDFHFASMRDKIGPALFYYKPGDCNRIFIRTTGSDAPKAIHAAEAQFKKYNSEYPFTYTFLEDTFNKLYQAEEKEGVLFNYFAAIAILISTLGLFGLAAYTAQVRTREIGLRKVLGASIPGIVSLLAKDFLKLVLIAIVIAIPIAWYAMNQWLDGFAYRTTIGWVVFLFAGMIAIVIAFLTISFQSVKAALANPVKNLRSE
jgi:putative ABC transport system permease protein